MRIADFINRLARRQSERRNQTNDAVVAAEVAARRRAEAALRESELHFRSVAQSACNAIISSNSSGKIIFWNKAAEAMFGYAQSEAIGKPAAMLIHDTTRLEERRREILLEIDGLEPPGHNRTVEVCGVKKDGSIFPIEVSLATWKTERGRFFAKTVRDISARRQSEDALLAANETLEQRVAERSAAAEQRAEELTRSERAYREQTAILQSILDSMGDGVVVTDERGRFVMCNPEAEELLGRASTAMVGQAWVSLYTPLQPDKTTPIAPQDRPLARALRGEAVTEFELFLRPPGNAEGTWLSATTRPLHDEKGLLRGGVLVFHDVAERKAFEAELGGARDAAEAANRAKSEFLANMSHEIRTPMTAILGFADRMLAPNQGLSDLQNWVQIIRRNGQHLLNLINDILDISKIEAGQMTTEKIPCDLPRMLADLRSLLRPRAIEKGLEFEMLFEGPIPRTIATDPLRMKQILVNLIGNSIKFTPGGRIGLCVSCDVAGASLRLHFKVSDTGVGMSAAQLSRLFHPFTQGDESTTRRFGGTGLGLTISRQLANLLGGDVVAESSLGIGSTFTATIDGGPAHGVEMLSGLNQQSLPASTTTLGTGRAIKLSGRILLAEDGRDNQRLLMAILGDAGAQVTLAENGRIAVDLVKAQPFDLILMDMQMPELDGYRAAAELRRAGYALPIIALTAHAMAEDRAKCLASGCTGYLTKPIDSETFLTTIAQQLGNCNESRNPAPVGKPEHIDNAGAAAGDSGVGKTQTASSSLTLGTGDAMTPTDHRVRSTYADLAKMKLILDEYVSELPGQAVEIRTQLSLGRMDLLKRLAHQLRGSGGGYGFAGLTDLAAQLEQAVKDQQPFASIAEQADRLIQYMRQIDGYNISAETAPRASATATAA